MIYSLFLKGTYVGSYISSICPRVGEIISCDAYTYQVIKVTHEVSGDLSKGLNTTPQTEVFLSVIYKED